MVNLLKIMVNNIMDNGRITNLKVLANLYFKMEIITRENLRKINFKGKVNQFIKVDIIIKVSLIIVNRKDMGLCIMILKM